MPGRLCRTFHGKVYSSVPPSDQNSNDSESASNYSTDYSDDERYKFFDIEPKKWYVGFMFKRAHAQLTDIELLEKMLHYIKIRDRIYLSDVDDARRHSRTFAFAVVTMTNTDEDILDEAELIVDDWIDNYDKNKPPFNRGDIFGRA